MDYIIVSLAALLVSCLTLFSGFGLGTLLMPVFAILFPVPVAVAATAIVHLANNLFKVGLVGRHANRQMVLRFAVPAALSAFLGAALLGLFAGFPVLASYSLGGEVRQVTAVKLLIGVLIVLFSLFDLVPRLSALSFGGRHLVMGGVLSGFFGGLSGNQGALRSAFLLKAGMSKEEFIGTGVVCAVIVDVARLLVYGAVFYQGELAVIGPGMTGLVATAAMAAFTGAFIGVRLVRKVTLHLIRLAVGAMMLALGTGISAGLV